MNHTKEQIKALADQFTCHPVSRSIDEIGMAGGMLIDLLKQRDELLAALEKMNRAYVGLMENGRDRIIMLGGDCDQVDVMERNDPNLCEIRATIASVKSDQFRDATKMADETSVPAIVFYPAGSLGEEVYSEGGLA
jgi:hypothetical protein